MTKILSSTILEIKLLTRSIWTYGAIILLGVYIALGFPEFIIQDDPGRALMGSAYVVVGGMILSLIWGYTSVNREKFSSLHETIQSYENGWRTTIIAKLLSLIAGLFFVYLFSLGILIIRFALADVPTDFWTLAFPYLLLYWILPFVVSGIIGMNIGLLTGESKISYLLIFIVWLLFSPLATVFIDFPYNESISKTLSVLQLFNIGQSSMFTPFDPVYGLPLETYRWWKVLFWLSLSSAVLYILSSRKVFFQKQQMVFSFLSLITPALFLALWMQPDQPRFEEGATVSESYDNRYMERPDLTPFDPGFSIQAYDIQIRSDRQLYVNMKMDVMIDKPLKELLFTLYHGFEIKEVTIGSDSIPFNQTGDEVILNLNQPLPKGEKVSLQWKYEGISSPYFFANEQAVYLPNYFPWYPVSGKKPVALEYIKYNAEVQKQNISYSLRYEGPTPLYTNLPQTESNQWEGTAAQGITLVSGMVTQTYIDGMTVVHPISLFKMMQGFPDFLQQVQQTREILIKDLQVSNVDPFPSDLLFIVTDPDYYTASTGSLKIYKDQSIFGAQQMMNSSISLQNPSQIFATAFSSLHQQETFLNQPDALVNLYRDFAFHVYESEHSSEEEFSRLLELLEDGKQETEQLLRTDSSFQDQHVVFTLLLQKLKKQEPKQLKPLLVKWRQELIKPEPMTWDTLKQMLEAEGPFQ